MANNGSTNRVLVDALDTLMNLDGTVQEDQRKLALGALVSGLTQSEIISLRIRLNAIPKPEPLARLPFEIHCKISNSLDLEESMSLRLVCLDWSRRFSSLEFCKAIIKRHFPAKHAACAKESEDLVKTSELMDLDHSANDPSKGRQDVAGRRPSWLENILNADSNARNVSCKQQDTGQDDERRLQSWLKDRLMRRMRRRRGQYEYTSACRFNHMSSHNSHGAQYCNGRIGYLKDLQTIRVVSFRNNTKEQFTSPQREMFDTYWALSDRFVVALSRSRSIIYAWPLESPGSPFRDNPHSQRLPSAIMLFYVFGDRIALYLSHLEIYIWTIGSPLVAIPSDETCGLVSAIVFHPSKHDTFFMCTRIDLDDKESERTLRARGYGWQREIECMRRTRFHFYEFEGPNIRSRSTAYLNSTRWNFHPTPVVHSLHDNLIGISNICGFRKLLPTQSKEAYEDFPSSNTEYPEDTIYEFGVENKNDEGNDLFESERSFLEFDMDTKQFQCHNYYDPSREVDVLYASPTRSFIWRNQTISVADGLPSTQSPSRNKKYPAVQWPTPTSGTSGAPNILITAVNHLPEKTNKGVYWYREEDAHHRTIKHHSPPSEIDRKHMTAFHWADTPEIAEDISAFHGTTGPCPEIKRVTGDEDFVVLIFDSFFVVWSFDPVIPVVPPSDE